MSKLFNYLRLGVGGILLLGGLGAVIGMVGTDIAWSGLVDVCLSLGVGMLLLGDDLIEE